jgi:hypothetical protein
MGGIYAKAGEEFSNMHVEATRYLAVSS